MVSFSFPALTMWLATVIYKSHDHQGQFRKPKWLYHVGNEGAKFEFLYRILGVESSYYVKYFLYFVLLVVQHLGQAWLCKYAGVAQRGCKQRPAQCAHGCKQGSTQCAHGCNLFFEAQEDNRLC